MTNPTLLTQKSTSIQSPLRYPGSKRRLIGYIKDVLLVNNLKPSLYIEPFIGGGSVALQLLQEKLVDKAILMDLDPWISSFWETVFFDTEWLIDQIQQIDVTIEKWNELKKSNPTSKREQAITCFFLNRTSFSGILESRAGPIGGKGQKSKYKIDCRFSKGNLISRIEQASLLKEHVIGVWNCSWVDGMEHIRLDQKVGKLSDENLFLYFDPPFFNEADALYRYSFSDNDHLELRDFLLSLTDKWILSYDFAEQVEILYGNAIKKGTNGTHHHQVELVYSIASMSQRKRGKEVIVSNVEVLPQT